MGSLDSAREVAVLVACLCLSLFFLSSALGKVASYRSFVRGVIDYQVLPERAATLLGLILPWAELALAFALFFGFALPVVGTVAMVLLACFIIAVVINLYRGREVKCNCYGVADTSTISWGTIVRNVLLLLLALMIVGFAWRPMETGQWVAEPRLDHLAVSLGTARAVFLCMLLAACFISILLLEWVVDVSIRVTRLRSR